MSKTGTMALWHHSTMSIVALDILYTYMLPSRDSGYYIGSEQAERALKTGFRQLLVLLFRFGKKIFT